MQVLSVVSSMPWVFRSNVHISLILGTSACREKMESIGQPRIKNLHQLLDAVRLEPGKGERSEAT